MSRTRKKPYTGSKRFDKTCRCNGGCPYCKDNRLYSTNKMIEKTNQELKEEIIMNKLTFPKSFQKKPHPIGQGTQWTLPMPDDSKAIDQTGIPAGLTVISVIGGGFGLHGDGVNTFEMWDFREDEPQGYLTKEEINDHLENNPL